MERSLKKQAMRDLGADRQAAQEDLLRQQAERLLNKREDQERYRQLLHLQVAAPQQAKEKQDTRESRGRMTTNEKKANYDDLQVAPTEPQEYKNYGLDIYTHSVPGLAPTVNPAMARKVLDMFGKQ